MNEKTEHPILFSAPMVQAILEGRKTQTRRLLGKGKPAPDGGMTFRCPYGVPGHRLWVKETFQGPLFNPGSTALTRDFKTGKGLHVHYVGLGDPIEWHHEEDGLTSRCRPSIYMPRWASRITLLVTDIRTQRLQDITADDVVAEGVSPSEVRGIGSDASFITHFKELWDSLNWDRGAWSINPWVWVVTFKRVKP